MVVVVVVEVLCAIEIEVATIEVCSLKDAGVFIPCALGIILALVMVSLVR